MSEFNSRNFKFNLANIRFSSPLDSVFLYSEDARVCVFQLLSVSLKYYEAASNFSIEETMEWRGSVYSFPNYPRRKVDANIAGVNFINRNRSGDFNRYVIS